MTHSSFFSIRQFFFVYFRKYINFKQFFSTILEKDINLKKSKKRWTVAAAITFKRIFAARITCQSLPLDLRNLFPLGFFFILRVCGSLNCPYLTRSPSSRVRWYSRHRQVGHFAKIVLIFYEVRHRRRRRFGPARETIVPRFIFGSLNLILVPNARDKERDREGERRNREKV